MARAEPTIVASSPIARCRKPPIFAFAYISPARSSNRRMSIIVPSHSRATSGSGSWFSAIGAEATWCGRPPFSPLSGLVRSARAARAGRAPGRSRRRGVKAARSGPKGLAPLTKPEREVLALLGEGLSNRQIAARLVVAPKTAENHVASVLFNLDLTGRAQAAAYAARHPEAVAAP